MIEAQGPIPFSQFMMIALYEPEIGYYVRPRSPFGQSGDFFTAAQLQPVFGRYVQRLIERYCPDLERFVDLGAGREDLGEAIAQSTYSAVHPGQEIPKTNRGVLFANEFFDALPIELYQNGRALCVGNGPNGFQWHPEPPKSGVLEQRPLAANWLAQGWAAMGSGYFFILDYGYRQGERKRFAEGTLIGYRRHQSIEDVLSQPGEQDLSAHVDWDSLIAAAQQTGWLVKSFESLQRSLLSFGPDLLEELAALDGAQLKTLLLSFGESFDVLILEKEAPTATD